MSSTKTIVLTRKQMVDALAVRFATEEASDAMLLEIIREVESFDDETLKDSYSLEVKRNNGLDIIYTSDEMFVSDLEESLERSKAFYCFLCGAVHRGRLEIIAHIERYHARFLMTFVEYKKKDLYRPIFHKGIKPYHAGGREYLDSKEGAKPLNLFTECAEFLEKPVCPVFREI